MFGKFKILKELFQALFGKPQGAKSVGSSLTNVVDNIVKKYSGSGMTDADKEASDISLQNARTLANEDYERKIDFYERFESPEAQVMQYKNAGINPALMYGSGPSVNASGGVGSGSAPAQSSQGEGLLSGLLTTILGAASKFKQIDVDRAVQSDRNDIARYQAETDRFRAESVAKYYESLRIGQDQRNSVFFSAFGVDQAYKAALTDKTLSDKERNEKLNELTERQMTYFTELSQTEGFKRRMYEANIDLTKAQKSLVGVQKAIAEAQEKYSDEYFGAIAKIQVLTAEQFDWSNEHIFKKTHDLMFKSAVAELRDVIIKAGIDGKAFQYYEKMTPKEWSKVVSGLIGVSIGTGGAILGRTLAAGSRAAAGAVAGPILFTPATQQWLHSNNVDFSQPLY